jgi:hypothetical protein
VIVVDEAKLATDEELPDTYMFDLQELWDS